MLKKKIKEKDIAEKTGFAQGYINLVKNGFIAPSVVNAKKICDALGETLDSVFGNAA